MQLACVFALAVLCCIARSTLCTHSRFFEEFFDVGRRITDPVQVDDIVRTRAVLGFAIRNCDEPDKPQFKSALINKIVELRDIFVHPTRFEALKANCPLTKCIFEAIGAIPGIASLLDVTKFAFRKPDSVLAYRMMLFNEFFDVQNVIVTKNIGIYVRLIRQEIDTLRLSSLIDVDEIFFGGIDMTSVPRQFASSIRLFVKKYFDECDMEIKMRLIAGLVEVKPGSSMQSSCFRIIDECGPTVQKIFQLLLGETRTGAWAEIDARLKCAVRPMSVEQLTQVLRDAMSGGYSEFLTTFKSFDVKPLAAATVGQGHAAVLNDGDRPVFVKVKKYRIDETMAADFDLMHNLARDSNNRIYWDIYKTLEHTMSAELDWEREVLKTQHARSIYHRPELGICVPEIYSWHPQERPTMIVMERVPGRVLLGHEPQSREEAFTLVRLLTTAYELWWEEALYGDGFVHGDVHGGNVLFDFDSEQPQRSKLYLIDYGNTKQLPDDVRNRLLELAIGMHFTDAHIIANGLGRLRYPEHAEEWQTLVQRLDTFFSTSQIRHLPLEDKITRIMKFIVANVDLPSVKDVLDFFRAKFLFDGLFRSYELACGEAFEQWGCPIPRTNAIARRIASKSFRNVWRTSKNGKNFLLRMMFSTFIDKPKQAGAQIMQFFYRKQQQQQLVTAAQCTLVASSIFSVQSVATQTITLNASNASSFSTATASTVCTVKENGQRPTRNSWPQIDDESLDVRFVREILHQEVDERELEALASQLLVNNDDQQATENVNKD